MRYIWKVKVNNRIVARGVCYSKEDVMSEVGRYFVQYSEEDWNKITLEIEEKGE